MAKVLFNLKNPLKEDIWWCKIYLHPKLQYNVVESMKKYAK